MAQNTVSLAAALVGRRLLGFATSVVRRDGVEPQDTLKLGVVKVGMGKLGMVKAGVLKSGNLPQV